MISPLNHTSIEFENSTGVGSRPSSTKFGGVKGMSWNWKPNESLSSADDIQDLRKLDNWKWANWIIGSAMVKLKESATQASHILEMNDDSL